MIKVSIRSHAMPSHFLKHSYHHIPSHPIPSSTIPLHHYTTQQIFHTLLIFLILPNPMRYQTTLHYTKLIVSHLMPCHAISLQIPPSHHTKPHHAANGLYDYPFTTVLSLAVPIAGFTLREQMKVTFNNTIISAVTTKQHTINHSFCWISW